MLEIEQLAFLSTVTGLELDDWGLIPGRGGNFSFCHWVQTGSGTYPASYLVGIRGSFPGGKASGAW